MAINNVTDTNNIINTSKSSSKKSSTSNVSYDSYTKKTYTYSDIFKAASEKYNISQELLEAVAYTESSFRPNATSYCGAQGLMQLMPSTAKSLGVSDAYNPVENVMGGAKYLSQMLKKYNGNVSLALAAYNGGPGNVAKYGGVPSFCQSYVNKVTKLMNKGVNVPNKEVTVNNSSKAATLMADYDDSTVSNATSNNKTTNKVDNNKTYTKYHASQLYDASATSNNSNSNSSSKESISYKDLFEYAAKKYGVSYNLLTSLAKAESNFDTNATSKSGAMGIMQLMPSTAKELGITNGYNPIENVLGGAKYNGGMGNVAKYNGVPPFCSDFVNKVINNSKNGVSVPKTTTLLSKVSANVNKSYNLADMLGNISNYYV